jgi:hypothetical protein
MAQQLRKPKILCKRIGITEAKKIKAQYCLKLEFKRSKNLKHKGCVYNGKYDKASINNLRTHHLFRNCPEIDAGIELR